MLCSVMNLFGNVNGTPRGKWQVCDVPCSSVTIGEPKQGSCFDSTLLAHSLCVSHNHSLSLSLSRVQLFMH